MKISATNYNYNTLRQIQFGKNKDDIGQNNTIHKNATANSHTEKNTLRALAMAGALAISAINLSSCGKSIEPAEEIINETDDKIYDEEMTQIVTATVVDNINKNKQKFESSKQYVQDAINELDFIHNEIWDNFPKVYNITKNLSNEFENYYSIYNTIPKIAAGESEPWKDVETGKDAALLISSLLQEATKYPTAKDEVYLGEIDAYGFINKGELNIINKVLDELEKINDDTKAVAAIYREELEKAKEENANWTNENYTIEAMLKQNGYQEYQDLDGRTFTVHHDISGEELESLYIEKADIFKEQAKEIENTKAEYEAAKADFLENEYTDEEKTEKIKELQNKFYAYYIACKIQVKINGNLEIWLLNPSIEISLPSKSVINNAAQKVAALLGEDESLFTKTAQQSEEVSNKKGAKPIANWWSYIIQ